MGIQKLADAYKARRDVRFLVVYQREPHAGQMAFRDVRQPETYDERMELARRAREELALTMPILIDSMDDLSRALFGDLPSPAIVIGADGVIRAKLPWAEPEKIRPALDAALAVRPTTALGSGFLTLLRESPDAAVMHLDPVAASNVKSAASALAAMGMSILLGRRDEAEGMARRAAQIAEVVWSNDAPRHAAFLVTFAELRRDPDLWARADERSAKYAPLHQRLWILDRLAEACDAAGRTREAESARARRVSLTAPK